MIWFVELHCTFQFTPSSNIHFHFHSDLCETFTLRNILHRRARLSRRRSKLPQSSNEHSNFYHN